MATRPADHSTLLLTDTTQTALVIGAAVGGTSGTGGSNQGSLTLNAAAAPGTPAATLYNTAGVLIWATVPVNTGSGTTGKLPKFTTGASGILGDSLLTESGSTVTMAGTLAATLFSGSGASLTNIPTSAVSSGNFVATVASGTGITSSVTTGNAAATSISLNNTAVTPATYGSATQSAQVTVDQQGRITSASNVAIAFAPNEGWITTIFENLTRCNSSAFGGGNAPTITSSGMNCDTSASGGGAACGASVYLASSLTSMAPNQGIFGSYNFTTKGSDGIVYLGNALDALLILGGGSSFTPAHWGFKLVWTGSGNAVLSATQSDGATESATIMDANITAGTDVAVFATVNSAGTAINYYYWKNGGTMSAATTLNTHNPTGGGRALECSVSNKTVASQTVVTFHGVGLRYA